VIHFSVDSGFESGIKVGERGFVFVYNFEDGSECFELTREPVGMFLLELGGAFFLVPFVIVHGFGDVLYGVCKSTIFKSVDTANPVFEKKTGAHYVRDVAIDHPFKPFLLDFSVKAEGYIVEHFVGHGAKNSILRDILSIGFGTM
jgi:hypothetical protein